MHPRQLPCWITHTNERTHDIIRARPRSLADVHRRHRGRRARATARRSRTRSTASPARRAHQIFLEPEGLRRNEIYPNGISTSLPFDVQLELVRSIRGLEHAHIVRPGYAIEYDYFDPRESAATRSRPRRSTGCSSPGQINGTTGYEEAAAQGLLAGINAARCGARRGAWCAAPRRGVPRRAGRRPGHARRFRALPDVHAAAPSTAYAARGQRRPAAHRDRSRLGLVDDARWERSAASATRSAREGGCDALARATYVSDWLSMKKHSLYELLRRPEQSLRDDSCHAAPAARRRAVAEQVEIQAKYEGYIERQRDEVERSARARNRARLPAGSRLPQVRGLSAEVQQKLNRHRPGHHRPGGAHFGHHAGGDLAAARASEARLREPPQHKTA